MPESIPPIQDPGDAMGGVPAMLGFYPSDSLVLVTLRDQPGERTRVVGVAARHDLLIEWDQLLDAIAHAAAIAIRDNATAVLVLLIDSTSDEITSRSRDSRHDHVVHSLQSALTRRGITIDGACPTTQLAAGSRWWSLLGPDRTGTIPDPETTALPGAYCRRRGVHAIRPSREHLTDQVRVNRSSSSRSAKYCPPQPHQPQPRPMRPHPGSDRDRGVDRANRCPRHGSRADPGPVRERGDRAARSPRAGDHVRPGHHRPRPHGATVLGPEGVRELADASHRRAAELGIDLHDRPTGVVHPEPARS